MILFTLLSLVLLALPIVVTGLIFFAAEHQKILSCGLSCGTPGQGGFPPIGGIGGDEHIAGSIYCQKSYAITPYPGHYICKTRLSGLNLIVD